MGVVILAAIFLLPFNSGSSPFTLFERVSPLISDISAVQSGPATGIAFNYILIIAFILLIIAGVVGLFPLGTAVLGIVGLAMVTVAPFLGLPGIGGYVTGYYLAWVASIVALAGSFWHRRGKQNINVSVSSAD